MEHPRRDAGRLPGVADRAAQRCRPEPALRDLRRLSGVRRQPRHLAERLGRVDDLVRDRRRRHAARRAVRRLARGAGRPLRVRVLRADGAVGGEHADARADAGCGRALAPRRDPDRHPRRAVRPRAARDHTRARRDADRAGVRVPDAGRDPVLRRPGRRGDRDDDLRRPRRGADHGARHPRRRGEHGRGRAVDGRDAPADPVQGSAAVGTADDHPRHQPDDPVRALARRDRGADRRARPRRRRHERSLLVPRARDPRRVRDRDHGDRARPGDVGDRRPHRPDPPPRDRRGPTATEAAHGRGVARRRARRRGRARVRCSRRLSRRVRDQRRRSTRRRSRTGCSRASSPRSTTSRTRRRSSSRSRSRSGTSWSSTGSSRCGRFSSRRRGSSRSAVSSRSRSW